MSTVDALVELGKWLDVMRPERVLAQSNPYLFNNTVTLDAAHLRSVHAELLQARKLLAARQLASCEPPLQHCAKLYHWVETSSGTRVVRQYDGAWFSFTGERTAVDVATRKGWRYVAPCEEPPQ